MVPATYFRHHDLIITAGMLAAIATSIDLEGFSGSFEDLYRGSLFVSITDSGSQIHMEGINSSP